MAEQSEAYTRGAQKMTEVYAGDVPVMPEGFMPFNDVMVRTLFAEVWTRDVLAMRDRRLLLLAVAAAGRNVDIFKTQAKAALKNGELSPDELRETLVMLAPYAGYPNVAPLLLPLEETINEVAAEQS